MELREYWSIVRRRWISVVCCVIAGLFIAIVFNASATRTYTATAQNFVALSSTASSQDNPLTGAQFAAARVKSYTDVVGSPEVLDPVVEKLGLPYSVSELAKKVTVTNPPQTVLLTVNANDTSSELAAEIANAVSRNLGRTIEKLETPASSSNNSSRNQVSPVKVSLIEPATAPLSPSSPRTTLNLAVGLLLGLAVGLGQAFLRHALDRTVKSSAALTELTGAPVLGHIAFDQNADKNHLPALDTRGSDSEGYRTVRASLQFVSVDKPLETFVITSAEPGDGKTTVSCNLAIALAQSGKSVCLIETDLRKPKVASYMGVDGSVGLTNVIANQKTLDEVLIPWGRGLVTILGPGSLPPNPSELLGSLQFRNVLDELKKRFDVVVIDSPPLLAVADAKLVGSMADGVVLVTRFGKTNRDGVAGAVKSLEQSGETVFGVILNAVPKKIGSYYGEYSYGYGYGSNEKVTQAQPATAQQVPQEQPAVATQSAAATTVDEAPQLKPDDDEKLSIFRD